MKFKLSQRSFYFLLSFLSGTLLLLPQIDFQPWLATGDHGLVLYAAEATLQGQRPYIDYIWFYGPFMPFYYSCWFKLLGPSILSLLAGQTFLIFLSGLLIYLILSLNFLPLLGLIGAVWFWVYNPDFFYTYNHTGGVTLALFCLLGAMTYLRSGKMIHLVLALSGCILLGLIKPNFGIINIAALFISVILIDGWLKRPPSAQKRVFLTLTFFSPLLIISIYWLLVHDMPFYAIKQNLQYFGNDTLGSSDGFMLTLFKSIVTLMIVSVQGGFGVFNLIFGTIILLSGIQFALKISRNPVKKEIFRTWGLLVILPLLFYLANLHEYLMSGVLYRGNWAAPFMYLFLFSLIGIFSANMDKRVVLLMCFFILTLPILSYRQKNQFINSYRVPAQLFGHPKAGIYIQNPSPWIPTVLQTASFLNAHLDPDDLFLVLPYDPLYYFLTNKLSPTHQLAFFKFMNIPAEEEHMIIGDLEKKNVNWIVISSRVDSVEFGPESFGKTHCQLLGGYIEANFEPVAQFGDWQNMGGFAWNHGTVILRRK